MMKVIMLFFNRKTEDRDLFNTTDGATTKPDNITHDSVAILDALSYAVDYKSNPQSRIKKSKNRSPGLLNENGEWTVIFLFEEIFILFFRIE